TYNENGFHGHPDPIQAHRVTVAALSKLDYAPTLYFNAVPESVMEKMRERWEEEERASIAEAAARGVEREPDPPEVNDQGEEIQLGTPDDQIDVTVDVSAVADAKHDALASHASQIDDSFWMRLTREEFARVMGREWFVRAANPLGLEGPAADIMVGYR
ncbi:MAG TPA: hypothetical protein VGS61_01750, partial [Acidimicrobiales bacterium]|nr:hypothetical protein [Acidimicrobiales bacterium]